MKELPVDIKDMVPVCWDDFKRGDLLYDTKTGVYITIGAKFYNVFCQPMFNADSDKGILIDVFEEGRLLKPLEK